MYPELIGMAFVFVLCYTFFRQNWSDTRFPPGPMHLPLVGNIYQIGIHPFKTFLKMKVKYGNIIGIKGPGFSAIVLNDPTIMREALNLTEFSGKMYATAITDRFHEDSNQFECTAMFQHRRHFLKTARNFGYGKRRSLESLIQLEVTELIENIVKLNGKAFQPANAFNIAVVNSLWTIVAGQRFAHTDNKLLRVVHLFNQFLNNMPFSGIFLFFPTIYNLAPEFTGLKSLMDTTNELLDLLRNAYDEHLKTFKKDEPRDYLDCYIQENHECKNNEPEHFGDKENNIMPFLFGLFIGGMETTSTTLAWAFMYLSLNQTVQDKMFDEIKTVVGISRLPSLFDRHNLPYVEATIMETLRMSSMAPLALTHRATETINFQGYVIPKGTLLLPNLYGAHHDPKIWGDPEIFRPERFITEDGKISSHKAYLPFGVGKRACLGESLAKDQLFLFLTSLVQKFKIQTNPDKPKPDPTQFKFSLFLLLPKPIEYILLERC